MRILVAFGSKRGGTEGIARIIGNTLADWDVEVEVTTPEMAGPLTDYDAAIIGGSLYAGRWNGHVARFVKRNADQLRTMPVWLFSSGPLSDVAVRESIPPTRRVQSLARLIGARGHATFGGRLARDARGFLATAMARKAAGDWRDSPQIRRWARGILRVLRQEREASLRPRVPSLPVSLSELATAPDTLVL